MQEQLVVLENVERQEPAKTSCTQPFMVVAVIFQSASSAEDETLRDDENALSSPLPSRSRLDGQFESD